MPKLDEQAQLLSRIDGLEPKSGEPGSYLCASAKAVLDALRLSGDAWRSESGHVSWIFRGQWNSQDPLLAATFREDGRVWTSRTHLGPQVDKTCQELLQRRRETQRLDGVQRNRRLVAMGAYVGSMLALDQFARAAERIALPLVRGYPPHEFQLSDAFALSCDGLEPDSLCPNLSVALVAQAQHHGIPTPFLDFTEDPLVAAFFAVESGTRGGAPLARPDAQCAVWAIDMEGEQATPPPRLLLVRVPRHGHSYLHAQAGVFMWDRELVRRYEATGRWESMDWVAGARGLRVRKFLFDQRLARDVRDLLEREHKTLAHMMPDFTNVAKSITWRW